MVEILWVKSRIAITGALVATKSVRESVRSKPILNERDWPKGGILSKGSRYPIVVLSSRSKGPVERGIDWCGNRDNPRGRR